MVDRWNSLNEGSGALIEVLRLLTGEAADDKALASALFLARNCPPPIGKVAVEHHGAHVVVICDALSDYQAFYAAGAPTAVTSAGTCHRKMTFEVRSGLHDLEMQTPGWDLDSDEPPPLELGPPRSR